MKKLALALGVGILVCGQANAAPKQIVCSHLASEEKVQSIAQYGFTGKAGDAWRKDTYRFDTNDFDKDIRTGTYEVWYGWTEGSTREMQYTVSPEYLGFNSDGDYPADHRISRKTLQYQAEWAKDTVNCVLEDVDTSDNLI